MLENVTSDTLTDMGAVDGAVGMKTLPMGHDHSNGSDHLPVSLVSAVTVSFTNVVLDALCAITVML